MSPQTFRDAMSHVAGAVHIVATARDGAPAGFTATAVAAVSDQPPMMLVCANADSETTATILETGNFSINTLAFEDAALAEIFAGRTGVRGAARFEAERWGVLATGAPALERALVTFDCRVVSAGVAATHRLIVGEVVAVREGLRRRALVYRERAFQGT
ncbi:MAG: flavin reductase [Salinarimonadaceae bacterium]|nr:MAG: flavin reductase [Salinarimonadaceae bacterium]